MDAGAALAAAARLGPYFAWEPVDDDPGWRPLTDLLDPEVIAERVGAGQQVLMRMSGLGTDAIGERVVASTIFLGLASRLVSPLLAAAALSGTLPRADPDRMWWRAVGSGPLPLAYGETGVTTHHEDLLTLVGPVLDVFQARYVLSPQVLWGNVASALGGAAGMIADNAHDPVAAERAAGLVAELLTQPPLRGMATLHHPDPGRARWFLERHNCCLYYRIPGGGTCGDCVLTPAADRQRHWRAVLSRGAQWPGD
ncbi:(2Fe-2S)-binding protein [Actinoplanes sp. LDG1-06]|uniref:(2Fe-2S)-binding protein n=1 Tax=Paractinoplanes ovalisporus TaxID=2810368 RepID=A0ABS2A317_9ACTN|nr:(2Fe-2S)-binding protein [Actinoplanes ovalisporus]